MHTGVCIIKIRLPENQSLKGKRQVINSLTTRVKNKYNVAIAEVDDLDRWQTATLGVACVSNSARHAEEVLSKIVEYIVNTRLDLEMLDHEMEIIPFP